MDTLKLARNHAAHQITAIPVPEEDIQKRHNRVGFRKKPAGDLNRGKNRLKSLLKYQASIYLNSLGKTIGAAIYELGRRRGKKDSPLQDTLLLMPEEIKMLRQLLLKAERKLRELMKTQYNEKAKALLPGA